ncbi:delta-aminolevulinic acid dehydratase [Hymenobacter qilianensis]|uniref:Delta-aminolevulinic acid dehydratase n=2 Tax=Hymenobacter qilianensis TaxID=1385715 RepID=A0ACB5PN36_9BACT|nr:porphobilinogen synthase [Hymenobacter qilianensis]QNP53559.1 porphobilinogen synthase [Hymenobacter qilianensis]GGF55186.1 delta-aminolevulinic acid dehydratase [Hymenobacter qilianensis]
MALIPTHRPRRNRKSEVIRNMVQETNLTTHDFIYPIFLTEGQNQLVEVKSMPGIFRYSADRIIDEIGACVELGIKSFAPFPQINEELKDRLARESANPEGLYLRTVAEIKRHFPEVVLMTDVAMDPYSSDGHDGIVDAESGEIMNDASLEVLGQMALAQARAGADIIGPSDMMDGRVAFIRDVLDRNAFSHVSIMSYTAKYASAFYGPFRDALGSAPKKGDKKTYQMNPANRREALRELALDEQESADMVMIKPALSYLDIIREVRNATTLPVTAYNVSGEYAMVKAAAQNGWVDGERTMMEVLLSIKRAGADAILTYFAKEAAQVLRRG